MTVRGVLALAPSYWWRCEPSLPSGFVEILGGVFVDDDIDRLRDNGVNVVSVVDTKLTPTGVILPAYSIHKSRVSSRDWDRISKERARLITLATKNTPVPVYTSVASLAAHLGWSIGR